MILRSDQESVVELQLGPCLNGLLNCSLCAQCFVASSIAPVITPKAAPATDIRKTERVAITKAVPGSPNRALSGNTTSLNLNSPST